MGGQKTGQELGAFLSLAWYLAPVGTGYPDEYIPGLKLLGEIIYIIIVSGKALGELTC